MVTRRACTCRARRNQPWSSTTSNKRKARSPYGLERKRSRTSPIYAYHSDFENQWGSTSLAMTTTIRLGANRRQLLNIRYTQEKQNCKTFRSRSIPRVVGQPEVNV